MRRAEGTATAGRAWAAVRATLLRPIWLPRSLYAALPWIYLGAGTASLLGGLFLPETAWLVPYLLLLGLALTHAGVAVASLRHRVRRRNGDRARRPAAGVASKSPA